MGVRGVFDRLDQSYLSGIVKQARQGDSNAFAELFASVAERQLYYLTRLTGSREEAVEMLPAVFTTVHRRLPAFSREDLFMPWICRITAQIYIEKKGTALPAKAAGDGDAGEPEFGLPQILNLPLAEAQIMLMSILQGLSDDEIGGLLNVGRRTVRRFIKAGRRHLAKHGAAAAGTGRGARGAAPRGSRAGGRTRAATAAPQPLTTLETSEILDKVYRACGGEANTLPMETLASYAVYRKERFTLQRVILAMALLVFMMLPLLFVLPGYTVTIEDTGERGLPVYTVKVDSILPVGKVLATIRDHSLPVYEAGAKEYTIEPTRNGELDISVELINHQRTDGQYDVTAVDSEGPELIGSETYDDGFLLRVSDAGIGVDYREIYAVGESGAVHYPLSASEEDGVLFEYPDETWDVYIPDHIGNTLHLSVKLK